MEEVNRFRTTKLLLFDIVYNRNNVEIYMKRISYRLIFFMQILQEAFKKQEALQHMFNVKEI